MGSRVSYYKESSGFFAIGFASNQCQVFDKLDPVELQKIYDKWESFLVPLENGLGGGKIFGLVKF